LEKEIDRRDRKELRKIGYDYKIFVQKNAKIRVSHEPAISLVEGACFIGSTTKLLGLWYRNTVQYSSNTLPKSFDLSAFPFHDAFLSRLKKFEWEEKNKERTDRLGTFSFFKSFSLYCTSVSGDEYFN
jgi:hypothetical protein